MSKLASHPWSSTFLGGADLTRKPLGGSMVTASAQSTLWGPAPLEPNKPMGLSPLPLLAGLVAGGKLGCLPCPCGGTVILRGSPPISQDFHGLMCPLLLCPCIACCRNLLLATSNGQFAPLPPPAAGRAGCSHPSRSLARSSPPALAPVPASLPTCLPAGPAAAGSRPPRCPSQAPG